MLKIGLTGGLASGKSSVGKLFAERGAVVFDADRIVHDLYAPGGEGAAVARELFGDAITDASGNVDRAMIAAFVFADPRQRHRLESRIHPLVAEVSQLLETATESRYDTVLLVVAPEAVRLARWEEKGGDPADARRRMDVQIPPSQAFDRVDGVIANDGSPDDLREKVDEIWREWIGG